MNSVYCSQFSAKTKATEVIMKKMESHLVDGVHAAAMIAGLKASRNLTVQHDADAGTCKALYEDTVVFRGIEKNPNTWIVTYPAGLFLVVPPG